MCGSFQDNYNHKGIAIANYIYMITYSTSSNMFLNLNLLLKMY